MVHRVEVSECPYDQGPTFALSNKEAAFLKSSALAYENQEWCRAWMFGRDHEQAGIGRSHQSSQGRPAGKTSMRKEAIGQRAGAFSVMIQPLPTSRSKQRPEATSTSRLWVVPDFAGGLGCGC